MTDRIPIKAVVSSGAATALAEFEVGDQIPGQYVSGLIGRNMLINCGLPINQRGFAGGALGAGVYGYDRWKAGAGGCNVTINATTGVFTHTSGPLQQIVEAPEAAWGVPVTLSLDSPSGTVSVNIGGATGSITAGAGRRSVTLTPIGSGNMTVQLTATGVTYSQPRLERGGVATLPEYRPPAIELLLCQRYFEKTYDVGVAPGTPNSVGAIGLYASGLATSVKSAGATCFYKVAKRSIPSVTVYSALTGTAARMQSVSSGSDIVASLSFIGTSGFFCYATDTGSRDNFNYYWHWAADAEI